MPKCPFCSAAYSPRAIQTWDERYIPDGIGPDSPDFWEYVEAYQCYCGAWWYEGMEDVKEDALPDD